MKLEDLTAKLIKLDNDIKYLVSASRFDWYDDLSGIEDWDAVTEDPNKLQFMKEFIGVMQKLQDVSWTMDYLTKPVEATGRLTRKINGRYALNGHEFTSGCGITAQMMKVIMISMMTAVSRTGLRQGLNIMAAIIISWDAKRTLQRFRYVTGADNRRKSCLINLFLRNITRYSLRQSYMKCQKKTGENCQIGFVGLKLMCRIGIIEKLCAEVEEGL